jgi:hypothetical protein
MLLITTIEVLMYYHYNLYDYIIINYSYIIFISYYIYDMLCTNIYIYDMLATSNINYISNIIIN